MQIYCANPECHWHTHHKGGRFLQMKARNGWPAGFYCTECVQSFYAGNAGKNLWDFTTSNISGDPVHVTSLHHLRQLEKQYGVRSVIANMDESHWNKEQGTGKRQ